MSAITNKNSTTVGDEELIEELKRYGETKLPTILPPGVAPSKSKKANQLNDSNRSIYLKKLNHYRAREKAERNPSKQWKNQSTLLSQTTNTTSHYENDEDEDEDGDSNNVSTTTESYTTVKVEERDGHRKEKEEDVVALDETEYVQMSNANTSPLSNTTFFQQQQQRENRQSFGGQQQQEQQHQHQHLQPRSALQNKDLNYVSFRDKFEMDKTVSKYRSEINDILSKSGVGSVLQKSNNTPVKTSSSSKSNNNQNNNNNIDNNKEDDEIVYEGTSYSPFKTLTRAPRPSQQQRPQDIVFQASPSSSSPSLRHRNINHINSSHHQQQNNHQQQQSSSSLKSYGYILSKYLPYLVAVLLTIIVLQYVRMRFTQSNLLESTTSTLEAQTENLKQMWNEAKRKEETEKTLPPALLYCDDIKDVKCVRTKELVRDLLEFLRFESGKVDCQAYYHSSEGLENEESIDADKLLDSNRRKPDGKGDEEKSLFVDKCVHVSRVSKQLDAGPSAIDSVLNAIAKNPHWNLRLLNENYEETTMGNGNESLAVTYLMSTTSVKPFGCRVRELFHFIYVRFMMFACLTLVTLVAYFVWKFYTQQQLEKDKTFFNLVSRVTDIVEKQYEMSVLGENKQSSETVKPYIAISHVYDSLFDASQRAKQKTTWSKVCAFIRDHESRIHLQSEFIDGEETPVWKWVLSKHVLSTSPRQKQQHFQGVSFPSSPSSTPGMTIGLANSTMIGGPGNAHQHQQQQSDKIYPSAAAVAAVASSSSSSNAAAAAAMSSLSSTSTSNSTTANYKSRLNTASQQSQSQSSQQRGEAGGGGPTGNSWQGDAFNRSEKLMHSPTPCLKIRNMFQPTEMIVDPMLAAKIHNDILEKFVRVVGSTPYNDSILHVSCDKKSKEGCVYVKCKTNEAAGRVYQSLNGTWYNSKLLNVKFLRTDRYLERFPDSIQFTTPLQPIQI